MIELLPTMPVVDMGVIRLTVWAYGLPVYEYVWGGGRGFGLYIVAVNVSSFATWLKPRYAPCQPQDPHVLLESSLVGSYV